MGSPLGRPVRPTRAATSGLERVAGIEPAPSAWKAEVLPLNHTRCSKCSPETPLHAILSVRHPRHLVEGVGFEPTKAKPSDLQSDPFGRSGTPPGLASKKDAKVCLRERLVSTTICVLSKQFGNVPFSNSEMSPWRSGNFGRCRDSLGAEPGRRQPSVARWPTLRHRCPEPSRRGKHVEGLRDVWCSGRLGPVGRTVPAPIRKTPQHTNAERQPIPPDPAFCVRGMLTRPIRTTARSHRMPLRPEPAEHRQTGYVASPVLHPPAALDLPPMTRDLDTAKRHLSEYGMCFVPDVLDKAVPAGGARRGEPEAASPLGSTHVRDVGRRERHENRCPSRRIRQRGRGVSRVRHRRRRTTPPHEARLAQPHRLIDLSPGARPLFGAATRSRTPDLLITSELLYRLSYGG